MSVNFLQKLGFGNKFFIPALCTAACFCNSFAYRLHIRKNKFQIYCFYISKRIYASVHMCDIVVVKTPYNMCYCIYLTYMRQKLISQSFAAGCTFNQSRNIYELKIGGSNFFTVIKFSKCVKSFIGNGNNTNIWLDSAERVVRTFGTSLGYCIKQCTFANVR